MIDFLPYLLGTISLLGGSYAFLLSFKIYKPKLKTAESKERMDKWRAKFGTMMKILSVLLILNGCYDLIMRDPGRYRISTTSKTDWEAGDRERFVAECLNSTGKTGKEHPQKAKIYCGCTFDRIKQVFSYTDYQELLAKSQAEQSDILSPVIEECMDEFEKTINM